MRSAIFSVVFAIGALAQSTFMINTPTNVVACQPIQITWQGGTPPYFLSILPGGQPSAPALVDLGRQDGTSFTWLVNQQAGTSLGLTLRDSSGQVAQSAPFTVNPGSDTSCIGQNPSTSAAGSTTAGATTPAGTSTLATAPPATSAATPTSVVITSAAATTAPRPTTAAATTSSRAGASSGSGTAPAASSTSRSAAVANLARAGAAGVVGAALAAILA